MPRLRPGPRAADSLLPVRGSLESREPQGLLHAWFPAGAATSVGGEDAGAAPPC